MIRRFQAEAAREVNLRRWCAYIHRTLGCHDLADWATLEPRYLIDRLVLNGYVRDPDLERSLYGMY